MPTDFLSLVRRQIFVTDIRCFVVGRNRMFTYVSYIKDCRFALRVKTLCKHMHCARVMKCDAVYFGINTILATFFHPENGGSTSSRGGIYLQTCNLPLSVQRDLHARCCRVISLAVCLRTFLPYPMAMSLKIPNPLRCLI
jgi:hypothetical protein